MLFDVAPYTDPLSRTPAVLRAVLEGRPDVWLDSRHAQDVKSPRQAVAHLFLCDVEDSWIARIQRVLEPGKESLPGPYDEMSSAELSAARPMAELLNEFEAVRQKNIGELQKMGLTSSDPQKEITYEGHGSESVKELLAAWVAHDLYHLGQIFKSYSALYIDQIGRYQGYLNLPHFN